VLTKSTRRPIKKEKATSTRSVFNKSTPTRRLTKEEKATSTRSVYTKSTRSLYKKKSKKNKGVEVECCICKFKDAHVFAAGLCRHVFCLPCLEDQLHESMNDPQIDDEHLGAPTLGRCPKCNAELRKFEMKNTESGKLRYQMDSDISKSPIHGKAIKLGNFHFDKEFWN
jgi:hypothetical protein